MLGELPVRSQEKTTIVEGKGTKEAIEARINQIRRELGRPILTTTARVARKARQLAGGVAVIKVGAASETELRTRSTLRTPGCYQSTVEEGMVPGGGHIHQRDERHRRFCFEGDER